MLLFPQRQLFHAKMNMEQGDGMPNQSVRLVFPPSLQDEPIITRLLRRYTFTVNIIRASVTADEGWMDIQVSGKAPEIEESFTWLREQGVEVVLLTN
jgi:ABC-type methionine transport system ATPase subunit